LSHLRVEGAVRVRPTTLARAAAIGHPLDLPTVTHAVRRSPYWVEARYLRTMASVASTSQRDLVLLWAFAMLDEQPGFALDVAAAYQALFGAGDVTGALWAVPVGEIKRPSRRQLAAGARRVLRTLVPAGLRRALKSRLR